MSKTKKWYKTRDLLRVRLGRRPDVMEYVWYDRFKKDSIDNILDLYFANYHNYLSRDDLEYLGFCTSYLSVLDELRTYILYHLEVKTTYLQGKVEDFIKEQDVKSLEDFNNDEGLLTLFKLQIFI